MTVPTPPGWYPDPGGVAPLRWWDGESWTPETSGGLPPAPAMAAFSPLAPQAQPYGYQPYQPYQQMTTGGPQGSVWQSSPHSVRALIVTAIYFVIAVTTPFGLLGIVPIVASIRAMQSGEKLATAAVGAAAFAFIIGMLKLTHHF